MSESSAPGQPTNGNTNTEPTHRGRTLILCFDGTANEYDNTNTADEQNVVRLLSCLEKSHPKQLVYYQTGIGTYSSIKFMTSFGTWVSKIVDQAIAWNLEEHVCSGYRFLQSKWRHGDKICIFGFSRGAYVARALAGMLHAVGLLPESMPDQVQFAYKLYQGLESGDPRTNPSRYYKRDFSRTVFIDFLGVWDTVSSVGILYSRVLPFSHSNDTIKVFRHAMALDERRVKFIPSPWRLSLDRAESIDDDAFGKVIERVSGYSGTLGDLMSWFHHALHHVFPSLSALVNTIHPGSAKKTDKEKLKLGSEEPPDVLEVWFAGGHCDVGGGNEKDEDIEGGTYSPSLANIPLRWMISELHYANKKYHLNIRWRHERLSRYGIRLRRVEYPEEKRPEEIKLDPDYLPLVLDDSLKKESPPVAPPLPPKLPRKAEFKITRCYTNNDGDDEVIIDEEFHSADLNRDIEDAMWCWKSPRAVILMMMWWLFEFFPFMIYSQDKVTRKWKSSLRLNRFRAREAPKNEVPSNEELEDHIADWDKWLQSLYRERAPYDKSVSERVLKRGYRPAAWGRGTDEEKDWVEYFRD